MQRALNSNSAEAQPGGTLEHIIKQALTSWVVIKEGLKSIRFERKVMERGIVATLRQVFFRVLGLFCFSGNLGCSVLGLFSILLSLLCILKFSNLAVFGLWLILAECLHTLLLFVEVLEAQYCLLNIRIGNGGVD